MKVVFHIDWDDEKVLNLLLTNVENLLKAISEDAKVCVVANGSAVNLFKKDSEFNPRVEALVEKGVRFLMCNNSLNKFGLSLDDLISGCEVVKAGVLELVKLQEDGYAYIKP